MAAPPRWYTALTKALNEHDKSKLYQVSTVDASNRPHARSQIHRGFLTAPALPALPVLLTSTDGRTPKAKQIAHQSAVEVCWWIDGSADQFRFAGRARVVGAPPLELKPLPGCAALAALDAAGFDWEAKHHEMFDAVSEHMRASWCRPPPGSVLEGGYEEMDGWPTSVKRTGEAETDEEKKFTQQAFGNYALMAIEPLEVDWVQMSIQPNRRTRFTRDGEGWKEEPIVP
ncbi:hypothetical protein BV25DRAFT_1905609 [Artomyces pyxidatus]|uniref:Uncharacterized protein n=1 Tax=Artomyces pyxidatus TaxID=48021 RepID=A0ACB8TDV2_9AGAM|nr:hypothetical protein BV25DRAFT_1905609 [Artomyces pyxidatus]